jgi:hypothetical protein
MTSGAALVVPVLFIGFRVKKDVAYNALGAHDCQRKDATIERRNDRSAYSRPYQGKQRPALLSAGLHAVTVHASAPEAWLRSIGLLLQR